MEILIILVVIAIILAIISARLDTQKVAKKTYRYKLKQAIMTNREAQFYRQMQETLQENQYIVPQAHLSMFLDHKIYRQNWQGAFSRINGKSVDFLIVEKETNKPLMAIELDDSTHERKDRRERDLFVEGILEGAGIPLKRYSHIKV